MSELRREATASRSRVGDEDAIVEQSYATGIFHKSKGFVPPETMQGAIMRDVKKRPVDSALGCDEERKIQLT